MLEHGVEEYNKDFPRLKIKLYEVQCFFLFLSVVSNALYSFIMDTYNQSCVAAFCWFHNEKYLMEAVFPVWRLILHEKRSYSVL